MSTSYVDVPRIMPASAPASELSYHVGTAMDEFVDIAVEAGVTYEQLLEMLGEAVDRAREARDDAGS